MDDFWDGFFYVRCRDILRWGGGEGGGWDGEKYALCAPLCVCGIKMEMTVLMNYDLE